MATTAGRLAVLVAEQEKDLAADERMARRRPRRGGEGISPDLDALAGNTAEPVGAGRRPGAGGAGRG